MMVMFLMRMLSCVLIVVLGWLSVMVVKVLFGVVVLFRNVNLQKIFNLINGRFVKIKFTG